MVLLVSHALTDVVAHQSSYFENTLSGKIAHRAIVLDRGAIVADGAHSELLRSGGLYADLWRKQTGNHAPAVRRERSLKSSLAVSTTDA